MDFALETRRALIKEAEPMMTNEERADAIQKRLAAGLEAKRIRAKNILGARWVLHPAYDAARHAHHNPTFKTSAVLALFNTLRGSQAAGRV